MLLFYINEYGETISSNDNGLVVQTSNNVDTLKVKLPNDFDVSSIVASITFRNAKKVQSSSYIMEVVEEEGKHYLTFLLNDRWFSSVKGLMEFSIRIYTTDTSIEGHVELDDDGNIVDPSSQSITTLVFTKGSYQVLEAVESGETPEIPEQQLEEIYEEIAKRPTETKVDNMIEGVTGISQAQSEVPNYKTLHQRIIDSEAKTSTLQQDIEQMVGITVADSQESGYVDVNTRIETIEEDLMDDSDIREIAQEEFEKKDKVIEVNGSSTPMSIQVKNKSASGVSTKSVSIELPIDAVLMDYDYEAEEPISHETVDNAEMLNGKTEEELNVNSAIYYIDSDEAEQSIDSAIESAKTRLSALESEDTSIKGRVSTLEDAGYITKDVNNLTNYTTTANMNTAIDNKLVNYTLSTGVGSKISLSMDNTSYVLSLSILNSANQVLDTKTVDLPLETMVVGASYSDGILTLTLKNGQTLDIDISDIVSGLVPDSRTINNKPLTSNVSLTLDDIPNGTNRAISAVGLSGQWGDIQNKPNFTNVAYTHLIDLSNKTQTTSGGYSYWTYDVSASGIDQNTFESNTVAFGIGNVFDTVTESNNSTIIKGNIAKVTTDSPTTTSYGSKMLLGVNNIEGTPTPVYYQMQCYVSGGIIQKITIKSGTNNYAQLSSLCIINI